MVLVKVLCSIILLFSMHEILADKSVSPARPRSCYSCESVNCQRTTRTNDTSVCNDLLDICVTIFSGYAVTAKGCLQDLSEMQRNKCAQNGNPECYKCFGQLCNNKGREDFKCIVCDSKDHSKCADDPSEIAATQCPIPTGSNSYCYIRSSGVKDIRRGCSTDQQDQVACLRDDSCSLCLSQDGIACNSYELEGPRSGATRNMLPLSLSAFILLSVVNLFN